MEYTRSRRVAIFFFGFVKKFWKSRRVGIFDSIRVLFEPRNEGMDVALEGCGGGCCPWIRRNWQLPPRDGVS